MSKFSGYSDYDSFTESSDSEDQESESTYGGNAQSILSSLDDSLEKIDDFLAYERGFVHGDIVCSITDQSGQLGRIINVDMSVDLESQFGLVKKDVNSKFLQKLQPISCDDCIVRGSWLGRVRKVHHLVTILFNDGAKCEVLTGNSEIITPISSRLFEEAPYPYYLGQRVKVSLPSIQKPVKWLCGSSKSVQNEGTICKVEVGLVHVDWIASVVTTSSSFPPHHIQSLENITLLSCFSNANWQLGDWCTLLNEVHSPPYTYIITRTKSKVDVMWQNGNVSVGLDAQILLPVNSVGDHDFWPGQFVLEKVTLEDTESFGSTPRLGIVKIVDARDRTIKVSWKYNEGEPREEKGEPREEMVSAYELIEHPDFSFSIGDIVFRAFTQLNGNYRVDDDGKGKVQTCDGHFGDSSYYLSFIGTVVGFKDEGVEVKWANGLSSKVHPSEIFGIERIGDGASFPVAPMESVPESPSNDAAEESPHAIQKSNVVNGSAEPYMNDVGGFNSLLLPCTSVGYVKSFATSLFSLWKGVTGFQILVTEEPGVKDKDVGQESLDERVEEDDLDKKMLQVPVNERLGLLKQFDIVDDYSDHYFANKVSNELTSQVRKVWLKNVQQEWSILTEDLPDSIYVRVYEERIDLLRACIIGAQGTPYHDGLFFFDIFFPPNYPHEPPEVHYRSGGLRLNPNLYESGKVCLSLLKTWSGTGTEVWDPKNSTILQVLLSLQALVLNDRPYFNEAGYDKQMGRTEGEKNSITYNENAFILSCKSMLYVLRKPPKHFEDVASKHFSHRSQDILLACKAYMNGAPVGHPLQSRNAAGNNAYDSCSTGFKIMLEKLLPKLVLGFEEIGIDCSQFR